MSWIYLSKKGTDEYVNMLAAGAGVEPTVLEEWSYEQDPSKGIVLRGIMKHKIMKQCWADRRAFRYIDTGYFGNRPSRWNPGGWKWYHRIVDNDLQHGDIIRRPADRWEKLGMSIRPWRRTGRNILIAVPDDKPCQFYNITADQWLADTVAQIKQHTDRPIVVRHRMANPDQRTRNSETSFSAQLEKDVFAVVTFNSTAAIESILAGIPVFVSAPSHAAKPVANLDLAQIHNPWYADLDLIHQWVCHLSYGQFHIKELKDGTALRILDETHR